MLDGHDLKTLNVRWLRSRIAMVGQEPKLFSGTIFENIAHGLVDRANMEKKALQQRVISAARAANGKESFLFFKSFIHFGI